MTYAKHFPSSPTRPPRHVLRFDKGDGPLNIVNFVTPEAARSFLDLVTKGEDLNWQTDNSALIPSLGVTVVSRTLEDIVETDEIIPIPYPLSATAGAVRGEHQEQYSPKSKGKTRKKGKTERSPRKKRTRKAPDGMVSIAHIADELGIPATKARKLLREAKIEKPDAGWAWDEKGAKKIRKVLKQ